jgi:hypothetical protein
VYSACGRRKGVSVSQIGQKEKDKWCNLEHFCVIVKKLAWDLGNYINYGDPLVQSTGVKYYKEELKLLLKFFILWALK